MTLVPPSSHSSASGVSTVTDGVTTVSSAVEIQFTSGATVTDGGGGNAQVAIAAVAATLTPTATQTSNVSATANQLVVCNTNGGTFTVTFPNAPADGTLVGVKMQTAGSALTLARSGSDTFDLNQTSVSMPSQQFSCFVFQYQASSKIWFSISGRPGWLSQVSAADTSIVVASGSTLPTIRTNTMDVIATQHPAAADWSNNSHKITSVLDPTLAQDAATKNYVDTAVNGLLWKAACDLATAAALPTNTYSNGASGVGATLTGVGFGALTVDGTVVTVGQRILVKNEVAGANNGIYVVTTVGAVATLYVLTRSADYNQTSEIQAGDATYVTAGSANVDTSWVMTTTGAITVGTTALVFTQFGGNLVSSVFSRVGAVVAATNDYTDAQIQNSPTNKLTATGDLLYASAANTLARRAIGSTGNVLTVSGGLPTWAAPSAGGATNFYKSGAVIFPPLDTGFSAGTTTQSSLIAVPLFIFGGSAIVFSSFAISCTVLAASSAVRLGFYDVATDGGPGALLYDLGTVSTTTTGIKTISSSFTIGPGLVWVAACAQGGAPDVRQYSGMGSVAAIGQLAGNQGSLSGGITTQVVASASCTGAFPNPFSTYTQAAGAGQTFPRYVLTVT